MSSLICIMIRKKLQYSTCNRQEMLLFCKHIGDNNMFNIWAVICNAILFSDIDYCDSNPCQNGATCNDLINSYVCVCVDGYIGLNCQTGNVNQILQSPMIYKTCNKLSPTIIMSLSLAMVK